MFENFSKQVSASLSTLKTIYDRQGQTGRILLVFLFVLPFCCLCPVLVSFPSWGRGAASTAVSSPVMLPSQEGGATPTALFDFDFPTLTPFPTQPFSTALPTLTSPPTGTAPPTQTAPTATGTALPTLTPVQPSASASQPPVIPTSGGAVLIIAVDKPREYVDIQNRTNAAVDLRGWRLVSETGNQSCPLRGTLQPNDVLRIWARRGEPGFDCRFAFNIWNDNTPDPAVLYNPQGEEVSRFP
jgi:hypothetical protein